MRILCCGDRNWSDSSIIERVLSNYSSDTVIIHGNANGADRLSASIALSLNMRVQSYPANWNQYGRAAGPIRNQQMLDEGKPDLVIAFHSNIEQSKGTKNMIKLAHHANIKVILIEK